MKACVLHAIGDLRCEKRERPAPQRDEVLVHIRACGICGSDIQRVWEKGTYHFPTIPGHEFAGEVTAVGEGVSSDYVGRRVAVFPLLPCFSCPACQIGEYAQCAHYDYYGSRRDGGFAEYLCVKRWNLVEMPEAVSFEEAAMCEPTAVAVHALSQVGVSFGDNVAIYGAGTIGLLLAKIARNWGAEKVILVDIDARKLAFANQVGFPLTINSLESDAPAVVREMTGGNGSDVTIEGTGASVALDNCLKSARVFGRVVLMGNPLKEMTLSQKGYWEILRKQLTLRGTWNSGFNALHNDWEKAIAAMPRLGLGELITHRYSLDECVKAFEMLRDRREFAVKAMFVNPAENAGL